MTTGTSTAASPKTVHMSVSPVDVEPMDTLQFTNNSSQFTSFDVVFLGSSPNGSDLTFTGTTEIDVPVTKEGEFEYLIRHHRKNGKCVHTGVFIVRSCNGGCP
jgi:plastocyanin